MTHGDALLQAILDEPDDDEVIDAMSDALIAWAKEQQP